MGCLPVTSKCCFFVPLRPGLLAWAYIKLVLTVAALVYTTWIFISGPVPTPKLLAFIGSVIVVTVVFSVVFVIGLHRENYKMVYTFYWFSILEVLITLGVMTWEIIDIFRRPPWLRGYYYHNSSTLVQLTIQIVFNILLPIYFIILIRSELLAIKGGREQPATTTDHETGVVMDAPVAKEQDRRYDFVYSSPEFEQKVNNTGPLFPVEELRIERLRQQLDQ